MFSGALAGPSARTARSDAAEGRSDMIEAQGDRWTSDLMMKLRQVGSVAASPNGAQVVFTITDACDVRGRFDPDKLCSS